MVAIKDFGMPSCCANCDFDALNKCLLTGQFIKGDRLVNGEDKRLDDCPLVEIEEHKVDKLEKIEQAIEEMNPCCPLDTIDEIDDILEQE